MFYAPFKNGTHLLCLLRDRRTAHQRIHTVRAVIDAPARFCALGVPLSAAEYRKSLGSREGRFFSWEGPVSVTKGINGEKDARLRIVFAYPASCRTTASFSAGKTVSAVRFGRKLKWEYFDADIFDKPSSIKNWVTFADSDPPRSPLTVAGISGSSLILKSLYKDEVLIPERCELLLMRVLECWCAGDRFYTNDHRTAGPQPRENGICDVRFELDGDLLTVHVLARGDSTALSPGRIEGWENCTPEMLKRWKGVSEYVLYCRKFIIRLPNVPL